MSLFLDICKVIGACSVVAVFGFVLYLLAFETVKAWRDYWQERRGYQRLREIADSATAELHEKRQLEALYKLPSREPRRRAL